jgi:hypothetical protein
MDVKDVWDPHGGKDADGVFLLRCCVDCVNLHSSSLDSGCPNFTACSPPNPVWTLHVLTFLTSALKMESVCLFETLIPTYKTTFRHIPEDQYCKRCRLVLMKYSVRTSAGYPLPAAPSFFFVLLSPVRLILGWYIQRGHGDHTGIAYLLISHGRLSTSFKALHNLAVKTENVAISHMLPVDSV